MRVKRHNAAGRGCPPRSAFTLVELLVTIVIMAILIAVLIGAVMPALESGRGSRCMGAMRQIGLGIRNYTTANNETFPRSSHSGFAHREEGWSRAVLPYLSSSGETTREWEDAQKTLYRCPSDRRTKGISYGLNVYFELSPDSDDYEGSPNEWRRLNMIDSPANTLMLAEIRTSADHVMSHFFAGDGKNSEVAIDRHNRRANYIFVDGHGETLRFEDTFDPARKADLWNPSKAARP